MLTFTFHSRVWTLFACVLFSHLPVVIESKDCVQNDKCSCTFDDGSGTVDLSRIGSNGGPPLIQDYYASDGYAYSFNPCYGFTEGTCVNAAGCQLEPANQIYYNIGDANKVTFYYDGSNLIGTYLADDGQRSSVATYICSPSTDPPQYVVNGETSTGTYSFTITASAVCPSGSGPPDPSPTDGPGSRVSVSVSISTGWILTIIFACVVAAYLVTGVVFNKAYRKQSGKELVPNVSFWVAVPGLIREGFRFTFAKMSRRDYQPI